MAFLTYRTPEDILIDQAVIKLTSESWDTLYDDKQHKLRSGWTNFIAKGLMDLYPFCVPTFHYHRFSTAGERQRRNAYLKIYATCIHKG